MNTKKFPLRFNVALSIFLFIALFIAILVNPKITKRFRHSENSNIDLYIHSFLYANSFWGARFPKFKLKEVVTDSLYETDFSKPTLVILFSGNDCRDCVKEELLLLRTVSDSNLDREKYDIIAIGITTSKLEILALRKITQTNYTYLFDPEKKFEEIIIENKLPLIFIVSQENMILSSYYPIPGNRTHSELFFNGFINLIRGMVEGCNSN